MQKAFVVVGGLAVSVFVAIAGAMMATSGKLFLRFYDFCFRGDYVGRTASWRKDVDNLDWKIAGVILLSSGLFMVWMILSKLFF